jgi:hypothetical protein
MKANSLEDTQPPSELPGHPWAPRPWLWVLTSWQNVRAFIQRGRRGWADSDTWNLDSYLVRWLPDALRYLKQHTHGIPNEMFEESELERHAAGEMATKEEVARAEARWNATLDKMIEGFEAYARAAKFTYEEELGPFPVQRPDDMTHEAWDATSKAHFERCRELARRDLARFKEGMALLSEHFGSLWN